MDCHHSGGCRNKFGRTYYLRGYNLLETPDDSKVQDSLCKKGMRVFYGILFAEDGDQESKVMSPTASRCFKSFFRAGERLNWKLQVGKFEYICAGFCDDQSDSEGQSWPAEFRILSVCMSH